MPNPPHSESPADKNHELTILESDSGFKFLKGEGEPMEGMSSPNEEKQIGFRDIRVSKILVHPIKSCRGTSVQSACYTAEGIENDRKWCIVDASTNTVITARQFSKMVLITPRVEFDQRSPHSGFLTIAFPDNSGCREFSVPLRPTEEILRHWKIIDHITLWESTIDGYICEASPSPSTVLSQYFGRPVHLAYKGPRPRPCVPTSTFPMLSATAVYQDGYPLMFLSQESIGEVERELRGRVGQQGIHERWMEDRLVIERFRPNVVVKGAGPFAEDKWEEILIGANSSNIKLVSKCARCLLPNVCTETGIRDNAVPYKVLMKFRTGMDPQEKMKPCLGCNGVPSGEGVLRVGDVVSVTKMTSG